MNIEIHPLLRDRRSGRVYDASRPVSQDDLEAVMEAARWAPSGGNGQPWRFAIGVRGDAAYRVLCDLLERGNRLWAENAPVLILTAMLTTRVNARGEKVTNGTAMQDAGMANMSMAIEAQARGLMTHFMGGYDKSAARELLRAAMPDADIEPVTIMSLGHPGDIAQIADDLRQRELAPRVRKPANELRIKLG